jgi:hypothetical protein
MTQRCVSQPISYLRLERHLQRDLRPLELLRVDWHLRRCAVCRDCFAAVRGDVVTLRPIPRALLAPSRPRPPRSAAALVWTAAGAAAAVIALWLRPVPESLAPRAARVAIKGGELALQLVREPRGQLARDATHFAPGDRFQALVSCPAGESWHWQLLVRQAGESYFPLTPDAPVKCANAITLPGAFSLDGAAGAQVCVVLSHDPIATANLERGPLPSQSACVELLPAPQRHP